MELWYTISEEMGGLLLPQPYWILSIIILITARRVPISNASWISAETTFFSSFILSTIRCAPPFYVLIIAHKIVLIKFFGEKNNENISLSCELTYLHNNVNIILEIREKYSIGGDSFGCLFLFSKTK